MKTIERLIVAALCTVSCTIFVTEKAHASANESIEYYVATTGNDSNSGTHDHPFQSVKRAQLEVRRAIAAGLQAPVSVLIAAGNYHLDETLVFDQHDSGTAEHAIRYAAMNGNVVTLSGGQSINNWTIQPDGRWTAALPAVKNGTWYFRQLVVDDERAVRARWPNENGELHLQSVNATVDEFSFDQPLGDQSLAGQDAELVIYQNWSVTRGLVTDSNANTLRTATPMGWIGHGPATTASAGKAAFLEHAERFLDQPGEWFLDRKSGLLNYLPVNKSAPTETVAIAPKLARLIAIAGTSQFPVRNLHFEGLSFEHTNFALPKIGLNEIQAAHYGTTLAEPTFVQPVAIECSYAVECGFQNCRFAHLNGSGIGLGIGCQANIVDHCKIEDIGGNGIMIGWRGRGRLTDGREGRLDADWEIADQAPRDNTVSNCLIRRCGADCFGGTGIMIAFSKGTRVIHNQIHDLPYTGVSVGFRWDSTETTQSNCVLESNHIFDVMQKLADGGGIYTLGLQPGTVFRNNYIHDVHRSHFAHGGAPNNGFFIDEGSKGFVFEQNVVRATSGDSVRFNNCDRTAHIWIENHFGDDAAQSPAAKAIVAQAGIEPRVVLSPH